MQALLNTLYPSLTEKTVISRFIQSGHNNSRKFKKGDKIQCIQPLPKNIGPGSKCWEGLTIYFEHVEGLKPLATRRRVCAWDLVSREPTRVELTAIATEDFEGDVSIGYGNSEEPEFESDTAQLAADLAPLASLRFTLKDNVKGPEVAVPLNPFGTQISRGAGIHSFRTKRGHNHVGGVFSHLEWCEQIRAGIFSVVVNRHDLAFPVGDLRFDDAYLEIPEGFDAQFLTGGRIYEREDNRIYLSKGQRQMLAQGRHLELRFGIWAGDTLQAMRLMQDAGWGRVSGLWSDHDIREASWNAKRIPVPLGSGLSPEQLRTLWDTRSGQVQSGVPWDSDDYGAAGIWFLIDPKYKGITGGGGLGPLVGFDRVERGAPVGLRLLKLENWADGCRGTGALSFDGRPPVLEHYMDHMAMPKSVVDAMNHNGSLGFQYKVHYDGDYDNNAGFRGKEPFGIKDFPDTSAGDEDAADYEATYLAYQWDDPEHGWRTFSRWMTLSAACADPLSEHMLELMAGTYRLHFYEGGGDWWSAPIGRKLDLARSAPGQGASLGRAEGESAACISEALTLRPSVDFPLLGWLSSLAETAALSVMPNGFVQRRHENKYAKTELAKILPHKINPDQPLPGLCQPYENKYLASGLTAFARANANAMKAVTGIVHGTAAFAWPEGLPAPVEFLAVAEDVDTEPFETSDQLEWHHVSRKHVSPPKKQVALIAGKPVEWFDPRDPDEEKVNDFSLSLLLADAWSLSVHTNNYLLASQVAQLANRWVTASKLTVAEILEQRVALDMGGELLGMIGQNYGDLDVVS